jgi:CMP-N,N'-diacetyllegionaminic acid synthase
MNKLKILWLIPARSGSKSIPNKNITLLDGIPLLAHRINTAIKSNYPEEIWISTDSEEYALVAKKYGAAAYFLRPKELALDDSSSVDVVLHAMKYANENLFSFDLIGLLEPTSPFITKNHLNEAIEKLVKNSNADSIIAVKESRPNTIFIQEDTLYLKELARKINGLNKIGRQKFKKQITPSGGFYISRWNSFLKNKSFYTHKTISMLVDEISGLEIDEPIDFEFANFIISKKKY